MNTDVPLRIRNGISDALRLAAVVFQNRHRERYVVRIDHVTKPDTHVEHFKHFAVFDLCVPLNELKDRMRLDQALDLETHLCLDPRQIEQPISCDIDDRVHSLDM